MSQQQLAFEQDLDPPSTEGESELVRVTTGMNLKEWIYCTQSSDAFMVRLNVLLSGHPRYPIVPRMGNLFDVQFVNPVSRGACRTRSKDEGNTAKTRASGHKAEF